MESTFYYKQQINSKITIAPTFKQNITSKDNFDKNQDNVDKITIGSIVVKLDGLSAYEKENLAQMAKSSVQLLEEISKLKYDINKSTCYLEYASIDELSLDFTTDFTNKKEGTYEQACEEYKHMLRMVDYLTQELTDIQLRILTNSSITNSNRYRVSKTFDEKMVQDAEFTETTEPKIIGKDIKEEIQETKNETEDKSLTTQKEAHEYTPEELNEIYNYFRYGIVPSFFNASEDSTQDDTEDQNVTTIETVAEDKPPVAKEFQNSQSNKINQNTNKIESQKPENRKEEDKIDKTNSLEENNKQKTKQNKFNIRQLINKVADFISKSLKILINLVKQCIKTIGDIVKNIN